jgi:4'-phosphopantetheinyl transferase
MIITGFNPLNTQHCVLNASRIDVWQFALDQEIANASQLLHADEQARADRFYFARDKRRFTTARAVLRIVLSRYLMVAPERLEFTFNNHGKPSVNNTQKLHFNLSHSGERALLAVGQYHPVGIDIEQFSLRPYEGIAKNMFSEQEFNQFMKVPTALKTAVFFHIWSQKEAFIKACGLGLSYPTKDFSVPATIPTKQLVDDPLHGTTWQLRSFMPAIGYSAALCYHPTVRELRHGVITLAQNTALRF